MMEGKPVNLGDMEVNLLWFDSLGAKSSSFLVETPDISLLVDPGVAVMQPTYPLSEREKVELADEGFQRIEEAAERADAVFISHYHYDHHTLPSGAEGIYRGKRLWIKDPNQWINGSQWERSKLFLEELYAIFRGGDLEDILIPPQRAEYHPPLDELPIVKGKRWGDYQQRKEELLEKGRRWFKNQSKKWKENFWVKEFKAGGVEVRFADGQSFTQGRTRIRFTRPLFHGIEYARLGWVIALVVEYGGHKLLYTSDLQGPQVEDYASWIIEEDPEFLIVDGPTTYLLGYLLNQINLGRSINNMCRIIRESSAKLILYDHHNLREAKYRDRLKGVYRTAEREGKNLFTAAEWFGQKPLILRISQGRT